MQERGAGGEDLLVGSVEVGNIEVKIELLRVGGVRPSRCLIILDALERQYQTRRRVQR